MNDSFNDQLSCMLTNLGDMISEKNKRYGDAALTPINIFSSLKSDEQIRIRIDDKISRIRNSDELRKNDVIDLTGYLVLLCIANNWINFNELID